MRNGFPYSSPQAMGLNNEDEAFYVTKMAIYCMLGQRDINLFGSYNGNDHVLNCLKNLVNIGFNGTETRQSPSFSINPIGEFEVDNINSNYLSQTLSISSTMELKNFSAYVTTSATEGTLLTDMSNNVRSDFSANEQFKILIPINNLTSDINVTIDATVGVKTYPVFFALAPSSHLQNYALSFDPFELSANNVTLTQKVNNSGIEITKIDEETKEKLSGVTFELRKENGEIIGNYSTDNNGKVAITGLYKGNYILKEIQTKEEYILNDVENNITLQHNQTLNVQIENLHKKRKFNGI